jgi:hypothetical protein
MPFALFILLSHLITCVLITMRSASWSRSHPMGAESDNLLLAPVLFASVTGAFIALPMLFLIRDLWIQFSKPLDMMALLEATFVAGAVLAWLPVFGLSLGIRKKANLMALLGGVSALATACTFLGFLYLRNG